MSDSTERPAPDFSAGFPFAQVHDGGILAGKVGDQDCILVRRGNDLFAVGAHCTHYHGPLADGLVVGDTVRCPWHHACFDLRTGEAVRAPALDAIPCWRVERQGDTVFVREKIDAATVRPDAATVRLKPDTTYRNILIVGGGAAGLAAADMLRRHRYDGRITMLSADASGPVDRPNLSKDYLAGSAQEDWIPLRGPEWYQDQKIELVLDARVSAIDVKGKQVQVENGRAHSFDALLIATGADPVHLDVPGAAPGQVHYLRTFADSNAIIARAASAKSVVVVGASFIGLEVAASLRARNLGVHVVAPDAVPLERVMGREVGAFVRGVHESHGVVFHLGRTVSRVDGRAVTLSDGSTIEADFLVLGVGVRPAVAVAERAGLAVDRGISVNEYLETSAPGIFAAGDVARWPDPRTGDRIRVEHWVVAERMGQTVARNLLGARERFDAVPFFWSNHYDVIINYVGHAERWDRVDIDGALDKDAAIKYVRGDRTLAVATIFRDLESLKVEREMELAAAK